MVFYEDTEVEQTDAFSITPRELEGYEEVSFNLLGNWKHLLSMTEDGTIQAEEGNNIAVGTYTVQIRVTNGDGTQKDYSFTLTVEENTKNLFGLNVETTLVMAMKMINIKTNSGLMKLSVKMFISLSKVI